MPQPGSGAGSPGSFAAVLAWSPGWFSDPLFPRWAPGAGRRLAARAQAGRPQCLCCSVVSASANSQSLPRDLLLLLLPGPAGPLGSPQTCECCLPGPEVGGVGHPGELGHVPSSVCLLLLVFWSWSYIPRDQWARNPIPMLTLTLKQNPVLTVVPVVRSDPSVAAASIPPPGNRGPSPPHPLPS